MMVFESLIDLCRANDTHLLDDPVLLEASLRDTCPRRMAKVNCLVSAVRAGHATQAAAAIEGDASIAVNPAPCPGDTITGASC